MLLRRSTAQRQRVLAHLSGPVCSHAGVTEHAPWLVQPEVLSEAACDLKESGPSCSFRRSFAADAVDKTDNNQEAEACGHCQAVERTSDHFFCATCGAVMPLEPSQTYFEILHQQRAGFKVDHSHLDRQYKHLQRQLHPDRFTNQSQEQKGRSADASALVNEAFSTLKNPLRRAEYMLKLQGRESKEGTIDDPELLMGIMEARESIEATTDIQELQKFAGVFMQQEDSCIQNLEQAFANEDLARAQTLTSVLKYLTNIQQAIQDKL